MGRRKLMMYDRPIDEPLPSGMASTFGLISNIAEDGEIINIPRSHASFYKGGAVAAGTSLATDPRVIQSSKNLFLPELDKKLKILKKKGLEGAGPGRFRGHGPSAPPNSPVDTNEGSVYNLLASTYE